MDSREVQQRRELAKLYDSFNDQALLAMSIEELTDVAREVYLRELQSRDLKPVIPAQETVRVPEGSVVIWIADTPAECAALITLLKEENCSPTLVFHALLTRECFSVSVPMKYAEKAFQLIVPVESDEEAARRGANTQAAFRSPSCPGCNSPHVVLESITEANSWRCEQCGFRWEGEPATVKRLELRSPVEPVEHQEKRSYSPGKNRVVVIFTLFLVCGLLVIHRPSAMTLSTYVGLTLCILGEVGWGLARWQLGSSFTAKAEARKLVTSGLYSRIQNPIYLFGIITQIGLLLYLQRAWWLMLLIVVIPMQLRRIRKERKVLAAKFGQAYMLYRDTTWF